MIVLDLLLLCDSPHLGESIFGISCIQNSGIYAVALLLFCWMYPKKSETQKKLKNKNCVCTFSGPVFCIIVSAWTCMIMEFKLVDGVQFFLVPSVLVALPPLW